MIDAAYTHVSWCRREPAPAKVVCSECGRTDVAEFSPPTSLAMVELQLCFSCLFWAGKVARREHPEAVRINGRHFWIGEEGADPNERGLDGHPFTIRFHDGRLIHTRNLWSNGEIPDRFRARLPDNAVFAPGQ